MGTEFRAARNSYYRAIRTAKRICWEAFLRGDQKKGSRNSRDLEDLENPKSSSPNNSNRCWQALRYTQLPSNPTTPALYGPEPRAPPATALNDKKALIRQRSLMPPEIQPQRTDLAGKPTR